MLFPCTLGTGEAARSAAARPHLLLQSSYTSHDRSTDAAPLRQRLCLSNSSQHIKHRCVRALRALPHSAVFEGYFPPGLRAGNRCVCNYSCPDAAETRCQKWL
ncbi:hypothetical protein GDO81_029000 [Engystomops pustulosus]|uniref:Secreted protein n=1 Tax=Engystomops pustulosus TaxID=76066 RepID=A0AAV6YE20_ENGPU|nr:hypothetical protein GDO81_029000 [Engystomops pustulosus]